MKSVLITRPKKDAEILAALLADMGITSIAAPLSQIDIRDDVSTLPLIDAQAVIFTSRYAVQAWEAGALPTTLPVIAVGEATTLAAKQVGFAEVVDVGGTAAELVDYVKANLRPEAGAVLYPSAHTIAQDIPLLLADFVVTRKVVYEAVSLPLSQAAIAALEAGEIGTVLFFSRQNVEFFKQTIAHNDLADALQNITTLCLSAPIAEEAQSLKWKKVLISPTPNQAGIVSLLKNSMDVLF